MKTPVRRRRLIPALGLVVLSLASATACSEGGGNAKEKQTAQQQLTGFLNNQPVPVFDYSQLRQNLIEIETAQAHSTQTTTFFFNQGVVDPIDVCPSIGFPIPSTYQLSNPQQTIGKGSDGIAAVPQIEANGVYTADSSGTYVICVDAAGKAYANYWEGFVKTVTGPAVWDAGSHQLRLTGAPTAAFTVGK